MTDKAPISTYKRRCSYCGKMLRGYNLTPEKMARKYCCTDPICIAAKRYDIERFEETGN